MRRTFSLLLVAWTLACASPRPVLYPNATYERVGAETAKADADSCVARAKENVPSRAGEDLAADTAGNAAAGGAAGAVACIHNPMTPDNLRPAIVSNMRRMV